MVAEHYSFTIRIVGIVGEAARARLHPPESGRPADLAHPERLHRRTARHPLVVHLPAGGLRRPRTNMAPRCRSAPRTPWPTWPWSMRHTARRGSTPAERNSLRACASAGDIQMTGRTSRTLTAPMFIRSRQSSTGLAVGCAVPPRRARSGPDGPSRVTRACRSRSKAPDGAPGTTATADHARAACPAIRRVRCPRLHCEAFSASVDLTTLRVDVVTVNTRPTGTRRNEAGSRSGCRQARERLSTTHRPRTS